MKEPFREECRPEQLDSLDWQLLSALLHEPDGEEASREQCEELARALREILLWILRVDWRQSGCGRRVGLRVCALAWLVSPSYFPDAPSLTTLAKRLGMTSGGFSQYTSAARARFGIRNRACCHAWNFRKGMERTHG